MATFSIICCNCGAAITLPDDINQFTCSQCKVLLQVEKGAGYITTRIITGSTDQSSVESDKSFRSQPLPPASSQVTPSAKADFITLACPACGANLKVNGNDREHFYCRYCGQEHIIRQQSGVITIEPVLQEIQQVGRKIDKTNQAVRNVRQSVDITASELAIVRLREDIRELDAALKKAGQSFVQSFSLLVTGVLYIIAMYALNIADAACTTVGWVVAVLGLLATIGVASQQSNLDKARAGKMRKLQSHLKIVERR